jgi:hypothetical protein
MVLILRSQGGLFRCGYPVERGKVDTADTANHVFGKVVAVPLQLKNADVLFRLGLPHIFKIYQVGLK